MSGEEKEPEQQIAGSDSPIPGGEATPPSTVAIDQKKSEIADPMRVIEEPVSKVEKLARLREAREVVEDDSDLNDIFMFVRSNISLSRNRFLASFPHAKALVITQEQMWGIEADGQFFSYIETSGKKKYVSGDDMKENLVLFLEDLGD